MTLWILSQDKDILTPINKPILVNGSGIVCDALFLGMYKSRERAMEVLKEIKDMMSIKFEFNDRYDVVDLQLKGLMVSNMVKVFEMPTE